MLIRFHVRNYKSFRNEAILDLSATKITEFSGSVISTGSEHVLPAAALYGANGSGKTSLYEAFSLMVQYVLRPVSDGNEEILSPEAGPVPFLLDPETENAETGFEVEFTIPGEESERIYDYGFGIGREGITEEWLNLKARTARKFSRVFYRNESQGVLEFCRGEKAGRSRIAASLNRQTLVLSLGAEFSIENLRRIREWFSSIVFRNSTDFLLLPGPESLFPEGFPDDLPLQEDLAKYLSDFDDSILGIRAEKLSPGSPEPERAGFRVSVLHRKAGSEDSAEIPLEAESSGTRKMLALYPAISETLRKGGVLFVDDLNTNLHPLLMRNLLLAFLRPDRNLSHAQLIFTSHDSWQLSNRLLRRDEIWFTEKDERGVSSLSCLTDLVDDEDTKIRKDENYQKNYLSGKYGAVPFPGRFPSRED